MALNGNATLKVADFNDDMVCTICKGYFRDCHTIATCLHSFCGPCLKQYYLADFKKCPKCKAYIAAQPHLRSLPDHAMQKLCDLLHPELAKADKLAEKAFYEESGLTRTTVGKRPAPKETAKQKAAKEREAKRRRMYATHAPAAGKARVASQMSVKLVPFSTASKDRRLEPLKKPLLKTSGDLRMHHLKKHVMRRLGLQSPNEVDMLCKGQVLGTELSLDFVKKTRWRSDSQFLLEYRRNAKFVKGK